jgi:ATP-dependent DNA ligase
MTGTYGSGSGRDWLKTKRSEIASFIVTGYVEPGPGKLGIIYVAEQGDGVLIPSGQLQFGVGRAVIEALQPLRRGEGGANGAVNVEPRARVAVKFFGRHKTGFIRDGVVQGIEIG